MKTLAYQRPHRLGKLHDELLAAVPSLRPVGEGLERRSVMSVSGDGQTVTLQVPDSVDEAAIAAVVAAHDATTPGPAESKQAAEATNEQTLRSRANDAVATLEQAHTDWATLTNAQKDAALRLTVRVTVALARLALRKLDAS